MKMGVIIGGVILAAVVVFMFASNRTNAPTAAVVTPEAPVVATTDTPESSEVAETAAANTFTVTGTDHTFAPNVLTVKRGEAVTIVFENAEGFHDFVIDEIEGAKTAKINAGESVSVTFTPTEVGSFEYYCSVGNHRARGMVGTLVVTD